MNSKSLFIELGIIKGGIIKGVRLPHRGYILGKQGTVNFTFFHKIEYVKFSNRFVANNSVLMIVLVRKLVGHVN